MQNKILFFGDFREDYSRNEILIKGLKENGFGVEILNSFSNGKTFLEKSFFLFIESFKRRKKKYRYVLVLYPAHRFQWIAWMFFRKKLIVDFFISLYDAEINDRKNARPKSLKAMIYFIYDYFSLLMSKIILTDSENNLLFYRNFYNLKLKKAINVYIGCDPDNFPIIDNNKIEKKAKIIHFHGSFIPLHGIGTIVDTAKILENENIVFHLYGSGQTFETIKKQISDLNLERTVKLFGNIPKNLLPDKIQSADICLGVFGDVDRGHRAIPNKIFEYMTCKKVFITTESKGVNEILSPNINYIPVPSNNPQALSAQIVKNINTDSSEIINRNFTLLKENYSPKKLVEKLIQDLFSENF